MFLWAKLRRFAENKKGHPGFYSGMTFQFCQLCFLLMVFKGA
jgi:hypothetical protein